VTIRGHDRGYFAQGSLLAARVSAAWDRQSQKGVWWVWKPVLKFTRDDHLDRLNIHNTLSSYRVIIASDAAS